MTTATTMPDVAQLGEQPLSPAPFPGRAGSAFRIYFDPAVHAEVSRHAAEDSSVEICGVLVGRWQRDDDGPYVDVSASIRGDAATSKFAEVTFTHETWARINARMDREFADRTIVGWYHTHPDFGVFLSDRDRFIHEHFFNAPGQIALVVDPVRRTEGVFIWHEGRPVAAPMHWVGGAPHLAPVSDAVEPHARGAEPATARPQQPSLLRSPVALGIGVLAFVLAGYVLGSGQRQGKTHRLVEGVAAQLLLKVSTLEAPILIDAAQRELAAAGEELARPAAAGAQPASQADTGRGVAERLERASLLLRQAREMYTLAPEEAAAIDRVLAERARTLAEQNARHERARAATEPPSPAAPAKEGPQP